MNPYHFVRFGPPAQREPAITHERFQEQSGTLTCRLTALTHLFIPKTQEVARGQHAQLELMRSPNNAPLLPGSSLKGVIRSIAEAISGSCLTLPQQGNVNYRDRPPVSYKVPAGFEHCRIADRLRPVLCPACRLFGSLSRGDAFLGKIGLSDAQPEGDVHVEWLTIEALMEPKPRHRVWYEDPERHDVMRGRKFYYHRPLVPRPTTVQNQYNKTIEAIKPGATFTFSVDYANLIEDELALFVFALALEPEMCHKVMMGKPLGLGSAKIEIVRWEQLDRQARYEQLGGGLRVIEGEALASEVDRWRKRYDERYANWQESLSDLRRIWTWNPDSKDDVKYPSRQWFNENRTSPIEEAP